MYAFCVNRWKNRHRRRKFLKIRPLKEHSGLDRPFKEHFFSKTHFDRNTLFAQTHPLRNIWSSKTYPCFIIIPVHPNIKKTHPGDNLNFVTHPNLYKPEYLFKCELPLVAGFHVFVDFFLEKSRKLSCESEIAC